MSKNLVNLNLKCLDKGVVAYYCIRCGNVQLELTEQHRQIAQNAMRYFEKYSGECFKISKCCVYFWHNAGQMFCSKNIKVLFTKFCIMLLS